MSRVQYDAIIVGARVAGSSLALLLGKQGRRVLLVDRDQFPSGTLSTHVVMSGPGSALDRLGVREDTEAIGVRLMRRARTHVNDCTFEGPLTLGSPGSYLICPRREWLDQVLIEHAARQPTVEFLERTSAEELLWDGDRVVGVTLRTRTGRRVDQRSRVVIGADGKHSRMARWVGAARYNEIAMQRPVYYAYYEGVRPLAQPCLELFFNDEGHVAFVVPMEPGLDCLVLEVLPEEYGAYRSGLAAKFEASVRRLPEMESRLEGARRHGPIRGTRGVENYFRVPYGPGWALTGDAAYCKDPITGLGIGDAFTQAFFLSEALEAAFAGGGWEAIMQAYHERRDRTVLPAYEATVALARSSAAPAEAIGWLRAVVGNPWQARWLAAHMPGVVTASGLFPESTARALARTATAFGLEPTLSDRMAS